MSYRTFLTVVCAISSTLFFIHLFSDVDIWRVKLKSVNGSDSDLKYNILGKEYKARPYVDHHTSWKGDSAHNIFWFLQISDIHIDFSKNPERIVDFEEFCRTNIDVIKPDLVLATGDLTHAIPNDHRPSRQVQAEWQLYDSILSRTNVSGRTTWLDMRGNHDSFDVASERSPANLFSRLSSRDSPRAWGSYLHHHVTKHGRYSFLAADTCPRLGARRPFNFFGHVDKAKMQQVLNLSEQTLGSNLTIWLGHYPSSFVISPHARFRDVIGLTGAAYLCGHLHDAVRNMYTRHPSGALELEVPDWKMNRYYRVLAVDHDLLSFADVQLHSWPVVLVTNPKHATYSAPGKEPLHRIASSSHIRILVFSPSEVTQVSVTVDGTPLGRAARAVAGPLWTLAWDPRDYSSGRHHLSVVATDAAGGETVVHQPFTLDGSSGPFGLISSLLLQLDIASVARFGFFCAVLLNTVPLFILRSPEAFALLSRIMLKLSVVGRAVLGVLRPLAAFSRVDSLFYSHLAAVAYISIGPWFYGALLEERWGFMFVHGLLVGSDWTTGGVTYVTGFGKLMAMSFPLLVLTSYLLELRYCQPGSTPSSRSRIKIYIIYAICFGFVWYQFVNTFRYTLKPYGRMAALGPVPFGSVVFGPFMWYLVHCLDRVKLVNAVCSVMKDNGKA